MGGILTSLNTSYTGLQAHQVMVDTAGNNIANANDEFYSRQKTVLKPNQPLNKGGYNVGTGVEVESIVRAHDEFVFQRYERAAQEKELYQTQYDKLKETASLFPDLEGVGIYNDLQQYFNAWKDLSKNGNDPSQKQLVIQSAQTLVKDIKSTYGSLASMQTGISDELELRINEVNKIGAQIAKINQQLNIKESKVDLTHANDLRDQRDKLEFELKELIGGSVFKSNLKSDIGTDSKNVDYGENYVLNVAGGFNIIDGVNFHPLTVKKSSKGNGLNHIFFQNQDFRPVDITNHLLEGKIGGLIKIYADGNDGSNPGAIQRYIDMVNTFANTFIETTNNLYAQSASKFLISDSLTLKKDQSIVDSAYNLRSGSFNIIIYDVNGDSIGEKTISVTPSTSIQDIVDQINANTDDNADQNSLNDIDDYFTASFDTQTKKFQIAPKNQTGILIGIKDNDTNFAGALGIGRFFDGNEARTMSVSTKFTQDPTLLKAGSSPASGDTDIANAMQQIQYDALKFTTNKNKTQEMQLTEYYQLLGSAIGTDTQSIKTTLDTKLALFSAAQKEHQSISQVSVDEEMVNLIKFQSGYAANAKVVSTIDKMIDTLLGIKQ